MGNRQGFTPHRNGEVCPGIWWDYSDQECTIDLEAFKAARLMPPGLDLPDDLILVAAMRTVRGLVRPLYVRRWHVMGVKP